MAETQSSVERCFGAQIEVVEAILSDSARKLKVKKRLLSALKELQELKVPNCETTILYLRKATERVM